MVAMMEGFDYTSPNGCTKCDSIQRQLDAANAKVLENQKLLQAMKTQGEKTKTILEKFAVVKGCLAKTKNQCQIMEKQNKKLREDLDISKQQLKFHLSRNSSPTCSSDEIASLKVQIEALKQGNSQNVLLINDLRSKLESNERELESSHEENKLLTSKLKALTKKLETTKDSNDNRLKSLNESLTSVKCENKRILQDKKIDMKKIREDLLKDLKIEMTSRLNTMFSDIETQKSESSKSFTSKQTKSKKKVSTHKNTNISGRRKNSHIDQLLEDSSSEESDLENALLTSFNKKTPVKTPIKTEPETKEECHIAPPARTPRKRLRKLSTPAKEPAKRYKRHIIYNVDCIFDLMIPSETISGLEKTEKVEHGDGNAKTIDVVEANSKDQSNLKDEAVASNNRTEAAEHFQNKLQIEAVKETTGSRKRKKSVVGLPCSSKEPCMDVPSVPLESNLINKPQNLLTEVSPINTGISDDSKCPLPNNLPENTCSLELQNSNHENTRTNKDTSPPPPPDIKNEDGEELNPVSRKCSIPKNRDESSSSLKIKEYPRNSENNDVDVKPIDVDMPCISEKTPIKEFVPFVTAISIKNDTGKKASSPSKNVLTIKPVVPNPVLSALGDALTAHKRTPVTTPKNDIQIIEFTNPESNSSSIAKPGGGNHRLNSKNSSDIISSEDIQCAYEVDVVTGDKVKKKVQRLNKMLSIDAEFDYKTTRKERSCVRTLRNRRVSTSHNEKLETSRNRHVCASRKENVVVEKGKEPKKSINQDKSDDLSITAMIKENKLDDLDLKHNVTDNQGNKELMTEEASAAANNVCASPNLAKAIVDNIQDTENNVSPLKDEELSVCVTADLNPASRKRTKTKTADEKIRYIFDLFLPYPTLSASLSDNHYIHRTDSQTVPPSNMLDLTGPVYQSDKQLVTKAIIDCFRTQFAAVTPDLELLVNTINYNHYMGALEYPEDKLARVIKNEIFLWNTLPENGRPDIAMFVEFFTVLLQKLSETENESLIDVPKLKLYFIKRIFWNLRASLFPNRFSVDPLFVPLLQFAALLSIRMKILEPLQWFLMHVILLHTQSRPALITKIAQEILNYLEPCDIIQREQLAAGGGNITRIHLAGLEFYMRYFIKDYKAKSKLTYVHQYAVEDHLLDNAFRILVTKSHSRDPNNQALLCLKLMMRQEGWKWMKSKVIPRALQYLTTSDEFGVARVLECLTELTYTEVMAQRADLDVIKSKLIPTLTGLLWTAPCKDIQVAIANSLLILSPLNYPDTFQSLSYWIQSIGDKANFYSNFIKFKNDFRRCYKDAS